MKIIARPEGREGIYLVENQDMADWLKEYPEDQIHNFLPSGRMMFGADWSKQAVIDEVMGAEKIAVLTGDSAIHNMRHALSVIVYNQLKLFDIGAIGPEDIALRED